MVKFTKEQVKDIKALIKQKNYLEVFNRYGIEGFNKYLSNYQKEKYRQELIKRKAEGTLIELFSKRDVQDAYRKIEDCEVLENSKFKVIGAFKYLSRRAIHGLPMKLAIEALILSLSMTGVGLKLASDVRAESREQYQTEIDEYNDVIKAYTEYIKSLNLTDEETVIKLVTDMWENIAGYDKPTLEASGYYGIGMMSTDSVGVCRNFADDIATKLNAINPNYNARIMGCFMTDGEMELMDDVRPREKILISNETIALEEAKKEEDKVGTYLSEKLIGNHAIVVFDMPGEKYPFVIDPTNPALGIIANGKVIMFNSQFKNGELNENGIEFEYRGISDFIINENAIKNLFDFLFSSRATSSSISELESRYGKSAQDALVERINEIDDQEFIQENYYTR